MDREHLMEEVVGIQLSLERRGGMKPGRESERDTSDFRKTIRTRERKKENGRRKKLSVVVKVEQPHIFQAPVPTLGLPWPKTNNVEAENISVVLVVSVGLG